MMSYRLAPFRLAPTRHLADAGRPQFRNALALPVPLAPCYDFALADCGDAASIAECRVAAEQLWHSPNF